jgi:hypothetical protein
MTNIHILPTDKPSRLIIDTIENKLYFQPILHEKTINVLPQHIYITSDEEIKEGDYYLYDAEVLKCYEAGKEDVTMAKICKKIILTTDQDLIKDGVQAIDDEFLEWFVKNPSCEFVDVKKGFADGTAWGYNFLDYKIIIPQEEPKQDLRKYPLTPDECFKQQIIDAYRFPNTLVDMSSEQYYNETFKNK